MFRRTWRGHWRPRREYLQAWARAEAEWTRPPVCDRPSCYHGTSAQVNASRKAHGCTPDWSKPL